MITTQLVSALLSSVDNNNITLILSNSGLYNDIFSKLRKYRFVKKSIIYISVFSKIASIFTQEYDLNYLLNSNLLIKYLNRIIFSVIFFENSFVVETGNVK